MAGRGQIVFHSGALFCVNTTANSTPIQVATLQETSFDFKATNKALMGENQFAEAIGRGETSITGKAKTGRFNGSLLNEIFFKQPASNLTSAAKLLALDEVQAVAAGAATVDNDADFLEDLGVQDATGTALTRVAAAPAVGQYAVNEATGVYTFNAGLTGTNVKISYLYETVAAGAGTIKIANQLAGEAPTFKAIFANKFQSQTMTLILNAVVSDSLGIAIKNGDFAMPDFGFQAQADANGDVGELSLTKFK